MPELPEVEVLALHLRPHLVGETIREVHVIRPRVIRPNSASELSRRLVGSRVTSLERRGKFLLFGTTPDSSRGGVTEVPVLGHLGMTGRMFVQSAELPLPRHTAVHLLLGRSRMIYQDPRLFGRFTLDLSSVKELGPEPLGEEFSVEAFHARLQGSRQPIKVRLLDQALVAGVGNIYASEALFRAGIRPTRRSDQLRAAETARLHGAIRETLREAIECGISLDLDFSGQATGEGDGLFYYGRASVAGGSESKGGGERLRVYDRAGEPCVVCGTAIRRLVQAARSTYFCPRCQKR